VLPRINPRTHKIRKIKKSVLATPAAPAAIPVNPKMAAIIAITKKIADHFSIMFFFKGSTIGLKVHANQNILSSKNLFGIKLFLSSHQCRSYIFFQAIC